ncbi:MAG: SWI/SNF chromatin-remodeling complex subunit [Piccolia ochrophora]|nr:MAG: SWI/SNF chromatin-remodeling complex subunit [Piccolia ochrophora]
MTLSPSEDRHVSLAGSGSMSKANSQNGDFTPIDAGGPVNTASAEDANATSTTLAQDGIGEGKQKAKAKFAASSRAPTKTGSGRSSPSLSSKSPALRANSPSHPPITRPTTDQLHLDQYVDRDMQHAVSISTQNTRQKEYLEAKRNEIDFFKSLRLERTKNPAAIFGPGYARNANMRPDGKFRITYPGQRRRAHRKAKDLRVSRHDMATQADQYEELIPVRLDIDWEKIRLRDSFTWNLHDRVISPELFAEGLVEDFRIPAESAGHLMQYVCHELRAQIQNFYPQVFIPEDALDPHLPYFAYKNDEMRILIKLNVTIGQHTLIDQFEWEINNPLNSPEEFAKQMSRELGLSGEFTTAIAHSIREQSQLFTKSLYIIGYPFDGRPIEDADLIENLLPSPLSSVLRPTQHQANFQPVLYEMTEAELDRTENSLSREQRRQKRSVNRRGGPALPDLKDRPRSARTLVISSVLPGAAESLDESRLFKRAEGTTGRSGRRAAQKAGADDSDLSESEDSGPDSPANLMHTTSGTARTRGMRGAASAAQMAMKANITGSATPEPASLHHHETRTSSRRFGGRDREDSVEGRDRFLVTFKVSREAARRWDRARKAKLKAEQQRQQQLALMAQAPSKAETSPPNNRQTAPMGPPPSTPGLQQQQGPGTSLTRFEGSSSPKSSSLPVPASPSQQQLGAIDAGRPPQPGQQGPPPPQWLSTALTALAARYPSDSFEATMRYAPVDTMTGLSVPSTALNQASPPNVNHTWIPRIRCIDCPGKLYTPGPGTTVEGFEVHLKNRNHREKVESRVGPGGSAEPTTLG